MLVSQHPDDAEERVVKLRLGNGAPAGLTLNSLGFKISVEDVPRAHLQIICSRRLGRARLHAVSCATSVSLNTSGCSFGPRTVK